MCKFYGKLEVLRNVGSSQVKGQDFSFLFFFLLGIKPSELCLPLPPRFEHQVTLCLGYYEDLADEFTKANWFQLGAKRRTRTSLVPSKNRTTPHRPEGPASEKQ